MKALIDRVEPGIWILFGGGFMLGSLLLPAYIFSIGIAAPLGWIPEGALSFDRIYPLASSPIGRLLLLAMIVLPIWNAANHLRHFSIDMGNYDKDGVVASALYLGAAVLSLVAIAAIIAL